MHDPQGSTLLRRRPPAPRATNQKGITIIETAVVMTISVILMTTAIPSFFSYVQAKRVDAATSEMLHAINTARTEAIKRGTRVFLCRTGDPQAATPSCAAPTPGGAPNRYKDWTTGWLMYAAPFGYTGGERNYVSGGSSPDDLIAIGVAVTDGVSIRSNSFGNRWLSFYADGSMLEGDTLRYAVCNDTDGDGVLDAGTGKLIEIPLTGRTRIVPATTCEP